MWAWGRACWCGSLRQSGASVRVSAFRHPQRYPQFHWLAMDATGLSRTQIPCCYGLLSESVDFRGPGWMSMSIIDHQDHAASRSEEHTSELQSLMRISYADFCLKKKQKLTTRSS